VGTLKNKSSQILELLVSFNDVSNRLLHNNDTVFHSLLPPHLMNPIVPMKDQQYWLSSAALFERNNALSRREKKMPTKVFGSKNQRLNYELEY
jgi:hypothetical protein